MRKVAAIQMCSSHIVADNLTVAAALIAEAAEHGANLIVLPENFAIMGMTDSDKVKIKEVMGDGLIQSFLSAQAKQFGLWIVGGTIPIACDQPNKVRAASLVFNHEGRCVARYDKIHLFDVTISDAECYRESDSIQSGEDLVVIDSPVGKLGLSVCYDIRFPELYRRLFNKGAEILIIPAAFTVKTGEAHWEVLARARAIENFSYVIGAGQVGQHTNGRATYGHSLIVTPWGKIEAIKTDMSSGIVYADIDLQKLRDIRQAMPVMQHQRLI